MDEVDGMAGNEDRGGIQVKLLLGSIKELQSSTRCCGISGEKWRILDALGTELK